MTARNPTYRELARILAERLEHHAALAGASRGYVSIPDSGCGHKLADADPDNCPFCADRAAIKAGAVQISYPRGTAELLDRKRLQRAEP